MTEKRVSQDSLHTDCGTMMCSSFGEFLASVHGEWHEGETNTLAVSVCSHRI